ncbi:MAG: ArnT family glycosyltransferase [Chloroflexota bacterium]
MRPSTADAVRSLLLLRARTGWFETLALAALWIVAVGIRAPYLWTAPAVGDDASLLTQALLRSQAGVWSGSVSTSVGAVHELLLAAVFALVGPSAYLPRLVTALQAALTIPLVYVLTRELCRPLGRRRIEESFLMPRLAGLIATGLLATSAAHIVITSHVARAESFTPLLVIALLYSVERALNGRHGRWLLVAGALFGLALQTSTLVLAIFPGLILALWWRARSLVLSHWSALAVLAFAGTYAGTLASMIQHGGLSTGSVWAWIGAVRASTSAAGATPGPTGDMYLDSVGMALVSVWRMLAGQLTSRATSDNILSDPLAWPFLVLALLGALILALRGRPLLPLVAISCLIVLPYVATETDPLLSGRYLMPVAIVAMVAIGVAVGALAPIVTGRGSLPRLALGMVLGGLVLAPLGGLRGYYDDAARERQVSAGLLLVPDAVFDERRYDEVVLLDEQLARVRLGAGGNALEALQYLLTASGVPTRTVTVTPQVLVAEGLASRALIVVDRSSVSAVEAGARLTPLLDDWITSEDGTADFMLFRTEGTPQQRLLDDGSLPIYAGVGV